MKQFKVNLSVDLRARLEAAAAATNRTLTEEIRQRLESTFKLEKGCKSKNRRRGAGYSIPAAAEEIGVSYKSLRDAIELGQVRVVEFGRITRVPNAEVARLKEAFA